MPTFLKSSAFRLTLLYMLTFGASVMMLLVFIYYSVVAETERQLKHDINVQLADLGRKFIYEGPGETAAAISHLLSKDNEHSLVLMLINKRWQTQAGNLEKWPGGKLRPADWIRIQITEQDGQTTHQAIAINSALPGGYILLVGRTLDSILRIRHVISDVLYICMVITALLAAAGGILLTLVIQRRIEEVNEVCRSVMGGELATRVAVSGSGDEFDTLADNLNAMLERICELIDGVRDISYSVAHDLRTPLGRLRNRLEALLHSSLPQEAVLEEIRIAMLEIDALVATFNAILRIAQAEMGAGIEHFETFALSETVDEVAEFYQPLAEEKRIHLTTQVQAGISFKGDRHLLAQACANLLDNAIKYTQAGGEAHIALASDGERVRLTVSDNGPGVAAQYYGRLTEKFYRLEASRSLPGNGLGLSLVQAAMKLHGGTLEFSDNQPGLKITLSFPVI